MDSNTFKTRIDALWADLKLAQSTIFYNSISLRRQTAFNRQYLKDNREGDYLIKVGKNNKRNWCGENQQYIDYTYSDDGWFALGSRKNAQWFSGKEAHEFITGKKGFAIVKK